MTARLAIAIALAWIASPALAAVPSTGTVVVPAKGVPPAVAEALASATAVPGARVEIRGYRATVPEGCKPSRAEATRALEQSGRQALRLVGNDAGGFACEGWAFADVKLTANAFVTTRVVKSGEPLGGAVRIARRELKAGSRPLHHLPEGARASRDLAAGIAIAESHAAGAVAPGEAVKVVIRRRGLAIETSGRAVACSAGRTCALTASGKRVEGRLEGDTLVVEGP